MGAPPATAAPTGPSNIASLMLARVSPFLLHLLTKSEELTSLPGPNFISGPRASSDLSVGDKIADRYGGKGVTSCATCDGAFFKNLEVVVVGGGDSAMEEALFLTKFASKVTIIHRKSEFRASKIMQDKVFKHPKINVMWNKAIVQVLGDGNEVTSVKLKDTVTNEESDFKTSGVFLAIGHIPNTKIFEGQLTLDELGYIVSDRFTNTNIEGVFAAGDVQDKRYRQAITAAGSGCQAAIEVERFLESKEHQ